MPWTRRQVRFLESSGSPLTQAQKDKMNAELHADPSLGHKKKGSEAMKKSGHNLRRMEIEAHREKSGAITGHTVHHYAQPSKKASKSGAFYDGGDHTAHPFGAGQHKEMMAHIAKHLGAGAAEAEPDGDEGEEEEEA